MDRGRVLGGLTFQCVRGCTKPNPVSPADPSSERPCLKLAIPPQCCNADHTSKHPCLVVKNCRTTCCFERCCLNTYLPFLSGPPSHCQTYTYTLQLVHFIMAIHVLNITQDLSRLILNRLALWLKHSVHQNSTQGTIDLAVTDDAKSGIGVLSIPTVFWVLLTNN